MRCMNMFIQLNIKMNIFYKPFNNPNKNGVKLSTNNQSEIYEKTQKIKQRQIETMNILKICEEMVENEDVNKSHLHVKNGDKLKEVTVKELGTLIYDIEDLSNQRSTEL